MSVVIKLRLPAPASLDEVKALPGLKDLSLDHRFGVVPINPKDGLYVVRADHVPDLDARKALSPEILEAYGDIHIGPA
jgi:hypothetical protein